MSSKLKSLVFVACLSLMQLGQCSEIEAEVVWIDSADDQFSILLGRFDGERWSVSENPIYRSDNALASPVLGTSRDGSKLLIWTEQLESMTVLKSMSYRPKLNPESGSSEWSDPVVFSDMGSENFSAAILFDREDQAWVFWSATLDSLPDIYLTRSNDTGWSKLEMVNAANDVPDYSPRAEMNVKGDIVVHWTGFDEKVGNYVLRSRTYRVGDSTELPFRNKQLSLEDIPSPNFIPDDQRVLMHFPNNRMNQSIFIDGGGE